MATAGPEEDKTRFRVVVSNSEASVTSDAARLRVNPSSPKAAAGFRHVVARKADGSLVAWGGNNGGRFGDGTTVMRTAPVNVLGLSLN